MKKDIIEIQIDGIDTLFLGCHRMIYDRFVTGILIKGVISLKTATQTRSEFASVFIPQTVFAKISISEDRFKVYKDRDHCSSEYYAWAE